MRVIVSGAGVGGLAVAQGLSATGHDVVLLERHVSAKGGASGYRLRLDSRAVHALEALVPRSLFTALLASGSGAAVNQRLTYLDHRLRPLGTTRQGDRDVLVIGRGPLLRLLAHGIEDRVRVGNEARSYQVDSDSVAVTTADGHVETGDLVVIAEGAHSALRSQLLGDAGPRNLGVCMVSARVPGRTVDHGLSGVADALSDGYALATGPGGLGLFLSAHDSTAGAAIDPCAVGDVTADLEDPYLVWALLGPAKKLPPAGATVDDLGRAVEHLTGRWHRDVRRLPGLADPASTQRLELHAARPVPIWPTAPVTILGDAIHAVPPTGGIGASTAIRDAAHLVEALDGVDDRAGALYALHRYEQTMRGYADDIVAGSVAPLRWQSRLARPGLYAAVTGIRAATFALTGRSLPLPSRT